LTKEEIKGGQGRQQQPIKTFERRKKREYSLKKKAEGEKEGRGFSLNIP